MSRIDFYLESALPHICPIGAGSVRLVKGWCYHPQKRITAVSLMVGDEVFPISSIAETRTAIAACADATALSSLSSGFWGLLPLDKAWAGKTKTIKALIGLKKGEAEEILIGQTTFVAAESFDVVWSTDSVPTLALCMGTYNPDLVAFRHQIESIRAQTFTDWVCIINDDGSQPDCYAQILEICNEDKRFVVDRNAKNLGFYRNFEKALTRVPAGVKFVALADQDDYWYPNKLETCIAAFDADTQLVYSDMRITQPDGTVIADTYWVGRKNNYRQLDTLLLANTVTGAASVFRAELLSRVLPFPDPVGAAFHDHWIAAVAFMAGKIGYIDVPLYDYIQHGSNVIGHNSLGSASFSAYLRLAGTTLLSFLHPHHAMERLTRIRHSLLTVNDKDYRRLSVFAANLKIRFPEAAPKAQRALAMFEGKWASVARLILANLAIRVRGDTTADIELRLAASIVARRLDRMYNTLRETVRIQATTPRPATAAIDNVETVAREQDHVDILMATYNGARFIEAQIASLQAQTHQDWHLWVRDDGSSDNTHDIVAQIASQDPRIRLLPADGRRLGASGSFIKLLESAPADAQYLMFCDQDDIWLPEKIATTLRAMQAEEAAMPGPLLVHSDLQVVDADLRLLAGSFWRYGHLDTQRSEMRHLVIHNNVTGCTLMINRALRNLIAWPDADVIMHDWWLALAASAFGRVVAVPEPLILYRQHSNNTLGAQNIRLTGLLQKFRHPQETRLRIRERLLATQRQAAAFLHCHAQRLTPEQIFLLEHYCHLATYSFCQRRRWLFKLRTFKAGTLKNLGLLVAM